ncbi:hypothetical protein GGX14DRAFT_555855 [Mycena pura]|uniref:DUF6729 domain-containing protein n=1 Tax=Mycena pura TaxID=153505 RepID=A0AAD6YRN1_9AGAR|nr:hypothetical protein GGX14DRAFT_555855 [Mycena pura]
MADDAPPVKKGRGGSRLGAGRPKGSRNKPKPVATAPQPMSVLPPPPPTTTSTLRPSAAPKRRTVDRVVTGIASAGHRLANFWKTSAPQGPSAMETDNTPDNALVTAHDVVVRVNAEMQAADALLLVSERTFEETVDDPQENDEGAALLDEVDGGDDGDGGDDETGLDAEQESAEMAVDSVNEQWLQSTLDKLKAETLNDQPPRVYRDSQLWIYPKDPIFALQRAAISVYSPDVLYQLPIFVWLPDHLPGHPDRFVCQCGQSLNRHGWNSKPIARRVCTTSGSDYFLLTKRYYCPRREGNDRGCGTTFQGTDPWILAQLPHFVQDRFPAAISHRSAVDISQMDMMKITFAGRFGPDPFSKMVRELKYLRHSRLEAMYLHAALHYGLRGEQIPSFSPFRNPMGFAGYAPSTKYLKSMFIAWFSSHRLQIDRIMQAISLTVDHQGRLPGGEPIHTALYDAVNTDEEGFAPLEGMYERVQLELPRHGHGPTEVIYCDNPRSERAWHERVTPSLQRNVQHIVVNPFEDLPKYELSLVPVFASSPDRIDTLCDEIVQSLPADGDSIYVALSLGLVNNKIHVIQLRTKSSIYVLDVTTCSRPPPSLLSVLTHPRIIKFGHSIVLSTRHLAAAWKISVPSSTLVDLGKLSKLKGAANEPNCSISTLCGAILKRQLCEPESLDLASSIAAQTNMLAIYVDCVWAIQNVLMDTGSVGIALQPNQHHAGQPVALVISNKLLAWGELVAHNGTLTIPNTSDSVKVTPAYSVIKLTKLFVPGHMISKHNQTLEWLDANGGHAVVQTRTLRSRAPEPPHPATESVNVELGIPAPVVIPSIVEQLAAEPPTRRDAVVEAIEQQQPSTRISEDDEEEDDLRGSLPPPSTDDLEELLRDSIQHAQDILIQPDTAQTYASRVLDDAYHFMDRLLRLLSKKHPAFKEFAHLFSETIFIRDGEDEAQVRAVLERKGIRWEYAIRALKPALHRRIRRYIPAPEKLVRDLLVLFTCFQDISDADGKKFFSKEARKQAAALIETARLGFLSDLPGLAIYHLVGRDKDGLKLYRTVRGTNSVEGGVHKQIRRIFGSLHASLSLTEAILGNWFLRRNRRIGHYHRTGTHWNNHFDIWLLDEIVETSIKLEVKPSFPEPKLLATRIATSETFGIIPITPQIAQDHEITILPAPNTLLASHHTEIPTFPLTQMSTKPVNLYRYLQMRQRSTVAVVPVHTRREFEFFQENIAVFIPANAPTAPDKVYKVTKYNDLARFWNRRVASQSPTELAADRRLYFKLPEQLERHHKKSLQWKTTRATLNMGENVTALEPMRELLRDESRRAVVLPPIMHEPLEVDFAADPHVGLDALSFNPTAMRARQDAQRTILAAITAVPTLEPHLVDRGDEPHDVEDEPPRLPDTLQTILAFESLPPPEQDGDYDWMEQSRPHKKAAARTPREEVETAEHRCPRRRYEMVMVQTHNAPTPTPYEAPACMLAPFGHLPSDSPVLYGPTPQSPSTAPPPPHMTPRSPPSPPTRRTTLPPPHTLARRVAPSTRRCWPLGTGVRWGYADVNARRQQPRTRGAATHLPRAHIGPERLRGRACRPAVIDGQAYEQLYIGGGLPVLPVYHNGWKDTAYVPYDIHLYVRTRCVRPHHSPARFGKKEARAGCKQAVQVDNARPAQQSSEMQEAVR